MLIIMLIKALCFIYSQRLLNYLPFNIFNMSVADEGYFRNVSCALSSISTFLLEISFSQSAITSLHSYRYNSIIVTVYSDKYRIGFSVMKENSKRY
jgi:hypothetical protein